MHRALAGDVTYSPLFELGGRRTEGYPGPIPSIRHRATGLGTRLGLERSPKFRICVDPHLAIEVGRRDRFEDCHRLEQERLFELEFEIQRARRDLRNHLQTLTHQLHRLLQRLTMRERTLRSCE